MLEADEGHATPGHHQLAGIGAAQTHHEIGVGGPIDLQDLLGLGDRLFGELHDIDRVREMPQVVAIGLERRRDHVVRMRTVGVEYVVVPVGVEDEAMRFAVVPIRRFSIVGIEHGEKIREQVDQHGAGYEISSIESRV